MDVNLVVAISDGWRIAPTMKTLIAFFWGSGVVPWMD